MEVKINKEIRNYTEKMYFGLSLRQFFFSLCACIVAIILYFFFNDKFNKEIVSWICIIGAVPFILLGFFKYNGLSFEQFIIAWIKSELLIPKKLKFISTNYYFDIFEFKNYLKGRSKINDKNYLNFR